MLRTWRSKPLRYRYPTRGRNQIYGLINCVALVNHKVRPRPHHSHNPPPTLDRQPGSPPQPYRQTTVWENYYADVSPAAANGGLGFQQHGWHASNQPDWKKSTGCLTCCVTSAHPPDTLRKQPPPQHLGLVMSQIIFPSLEHKPCYGSAAHESRCITFSIRNQSVCPSENQ